MGSKELNSAKKYLSWAHVAASVVDEKGRVYQKTSSCTDTTGVVLPEVRKKKNESLMDSA